MVAYNRFKKGLFSFNEKLAHALKVNSNYSDANFDVKSFFMKALPKKSSASKILYC